MYKYLICDLDGTLLPPDGGIHVSKNIEEAFIKLQEKGIKIILASARIFQGIYPLAKQIKMDKYGGYIIASGGTYAYDMQKEKTIYNFDIKKEDALKMWKEIIKYADFGIGLPSYMLASDMSEGFELDRFNCAVDYLLTSQPEKYIKEKIWKCSISKNKKVLDLYFDDFVEMCKPYKVIRSTDTFIDILDASCSKEKGVDLLFKHCGFKLAEACAIGDGDSDANMIQQAGYGVTLENGSELCKKYAKRIVPSYKNEGCLELFQELLKQ